MDLSENSPLNDLKTDAAQSGLPVMGTNQSTVRAHNERLVLSLIRHLGPLPKAEIARRSGLSAQTVSVIMRALESDGLLIKGKPQRGKVGQPSVPMDLAHDGAYFFGLKVGRRSLELVLTDFFGKIVDSRQHMHKFPTPSAAVSFALQSCEAIISALDPPARARIAGMGIAMPFSLWDWAGALGLNPTDMADWKTRDIRSEIATEMPFEVYLENDASCACGAELVFGTHDTPKDFLHFYIAFFVGGGLVLENRLYRGSTGNAGAVGSMPVPAPDGSVRQLVDVASLAGLERACLETGQDPSSIWQISDAWNIEETLLDHWINEAAKGLAYAAASSVALLDLSHVVIDGWMPEAIRARLVRAVEGEIAQLNLAGLSLPTIAAGTIGRMARSLGAASLPLAERYLIDHNALGGLMHKKENT